MFRYIEDINLSSAGPIGCLALGVLCSKPFYKDEVDDWDGL